MWKKGMVIFIVCLQRQLTMAQKMNRKPDGFVCAGNDKAVIATLDRLIGAGRQVA
jgi:hypothetical protein